MNEREREIATNEHSPYQFHNTSYEEGMFCVELLNKCKDFNDANLEEKQRCEIVMINLKKQSRIGKEKIYVYSGAYKLKDNGENRTFNGTIFYTDEKIDIVNLIERLCITDESNIPKRYRTVDTFKHIEEDIYERKSSYNYLDETIEPKQVQISKISEKIKK